MLTKGEYFGLWLGGAGAEQVKSAEGLLSAVNGLMAEMEAEGVKFPKNPATGSQVSRLKYGGFRPQDCPEGAPKSSHKLGLAVDLYDPEGVIDVWCFAHQDRLKAHGIFIEHPDFTKGWSHWTTRAPKSGRTVFFP